jgi:predicted ArsR family transcriptional regulator
VTDGLDARSEPTDRRRDALSVPTRRRIFELVEAGPPVGVSALAGATGLHPNTVRLHLARLLDAGLITQETSPAGGPGRPGFLYRAAAPDPVRAARAYQQLAAWLAEAVRTRSSARAVGNRVGRDEAVRLSRDGHAVPGLYRALERLGFAPEREVEVTGARDTLVLRRCPFAAAAADDPATICGLHLGIAEGIMTSAGDPRVVGLDAVAAPRAGGCRLTFTEVEAGA